LFCGIPGTAPDELLDAGALLVVELSAGGEELDVLLEPLLPPPHPAIASATSPAAMNPVSVLRNFELIWMTSVVCVPAPQAIGERLA
jgi:hypothetical protein